MTESNTSFLKQLLVFVNKEFKHVFRDRKTLLLLFGLPIVQIVLFGFALSNEIKKSELLVVNYAQDDVSRKLVHEIDASNYFSVTQSDLNIASADAAFKSSSAKMVLVIPAHFGSNFFSGKKTQLQLITDASDPNTATTLTNYLSVIVGEFQREQLKVDKIPYQINVSTRMLYNPQLKGAPSFVPGVMALVLLLVCVMMTSISIVKEKELGTMEILLVSPFKPILVIISKAIPYLVLSLVNVVVILFLSVALLELPLKGSLLLLFAECTLFIFTALSLGLLISTKTASQQTAMLLSLMGMLLPTLLFSGFMFPIENMPLPLQLISNLVPAKWFYIIVKGIMIKGVGFSAIWLETVVLLVMTIAFLFLSIKSFNIRLAK